MIHVITGATGLVGRALITALLERDQRVLALSRTAEIGLRDVAHQSLEARNFNLAEDDPSELPLPEEECSLVMLASSITTSRNLTELGPILSLDTYGHLRLAEAMRPRLTWALYASSSTVYGFPHEFPVGESAPLAPWNAYALVKAATEKAARQLLSGWSVPLATLRITQVYGPGAEGSGAMYAFLESAARDRNPCIIVNPTAFRDYCHVDDVIQAALAALERNANGVFNIGSGTPTTLLELAECCLYAAGSSRRPEVKHQTDTYSMLLAIQRAGSELGYRPRVTLAEGVKREYVRLYSGTLPG